MNQDPPHTPTETWTTRRLLQWISDYLSRKELDAPRLSAELLLAHVLGCERLRLYMEADRPATPAERERLRALVERAGRHEPIQYLLGEAWFFGLRFRVGPEVLIPRPSTETIVEHVAQQERRLHLDEREEVRERERAELRAQAQALLERDADATEAEAAPPASNPGNPGGDGVPEAAPTGPPVWIADIGTGSGAIVIAMLHTLRHARGVGTDISAEAIALAKANAAALGVTDRLEFRLGSLLEALEGHPQFGGFDYLVSNPPYIADHEWGDVDRNVREYEPAHALRAGSEGLDVLAPLIARCHTAIRPQGTVAIEIGHAQGAAVQALALANADLEDVRILRDHEGHDRVLIARRRSADADG